MKNSALAMLLICAGSAFGQVAVESPDFEVVERYLADLQLDELRAEYLESQLDSLGGADRTSVARRLAELYARLLRASEQDDERVRLEGKARVLLEAMPEIDADDLRLSLARAGFERAERVVERWRVRAVPEPEARSALRSIRTLAQDFERIGRDAHRRVQSLESREERARDADLPMLERRIDEALERRSTAFYLAGWAHRYLAEFENDHESARLSRISFGWILNASQSEEPVIDRVPEGFERLPHVALSMLCVSYTHALSGRMPLADEWYERVRDAGEIGGGVTDQLPTRRLIALCAGGRWQDATRLLDAHVSGEQGALLARLGAVLATTELESGTSDRSPRTLRDAALAALVARGELAQAVEVINAIGSSTLDPSGFVGGLVQGVVAYQSLRDEHREAGNAGEPARDPALRERYAAIGEQLRSALYSSGSSAFPQARAGGLFVVGLCSYYAGDFQEAARSFEAAAADEDGSPTMADALWMAILAYDRLPDADGRKAALTDRFLAEFPDHERASALAMRRALQRDDDPERSIEVLLEVAPSDPSYDGARRQAARLAYQQAVNATSSNAGVRARRFLAIAEPLLASDRRAASESSEAADRAATQARRILGVALRMDPPETSRASRAFDALDSMIDAGLVDATSFEGELVFRRAEYALALDDVEQAERYFDELQRIDPALAAQGDRLIWRDALRVWRRVRPSGAEESVARAAGRVVRIAERLIEAMGDPESALADDANASVMRAAAQAGADMWRTQRDASSRDLAATWYALLIEHAGASQDSLVGFVELARARGDNQGALDAQRRLVAGLEPGSRDWYRARTLQLEILADVDASRARDALRQHIALYPELAPEPWGERLRQLARRLSIDPESIG